MARIFLGVAWPYANGPFHIGHLAGAYLPADIFARYHRLVGDEVLMVSGSDMHGTPILVAAEKEGTTPDVVAERNHALNSASFRRLGISFDLFTSTRTPIHERVVQELFLALLRDGHVERRTESSPYCPKHARFLPDRYLIGTCPNCGSESARGDECDRCGKVLQAKELLQPRCVLCNTPAEFRNSEHFFLRLDGLSVELDKFLADKSYWRPNVRTFTERFREGGLRPTPITRDLTWGVPIPLDGYDSKRFYVWFEAVIGYLSASQEWAVRLGTPDAWHRFWDAKEAVRSYYFIGKDNIFHHTVFWPAMLLGVGGLRLPYDVPANEWMVIGGGKMSKSRPTTEDVSFPALLEKHPPEAIRFYAALLAPQNHDTEFSSDELRQVTDQVLANQWGNLVQRLLVLARDRCDGRVPPRPDGWELASSPWGARTIAAHAAIGAEYEKVHLKEALELALIEVRDANRRVHEAAPWAAAEPERNRALYEGLAFVKTAAVWMAPVLPASADSVFRMLGYPTGPTPGAWATALEPAPPGQKLGEIQPLYPRDAPTQPPASSTPAPGGALDLRAGAIREVTPVADADKLYHVTVDVGPLGSRHVVAGLRPYFAESELVGRSVVLLANLAPRKIRGQSSEGMLLAADAGDKVELLQPPDGAAPGDGSGAREVAPVITYDQFSARPMCVGESLGPTAGGRSRISLGDVAVEVDGEWAVGTRLVIERGADATAPARVVTLADRRPLRVGDGAAPGARIR
ncbi:MAG: methionine--tRNA ligase [Thermoplasmata archaeon]|nr:methionine--tRNA ligase [Thermoplasmata archaeon]